MADDRVGSPSVLLHYAQTLDGRIATREGHSQWISCAASLRLAHQLRAENHAIMVGVGTVIADNPQLTVRLVPGRSPVRIVADSTLRLPLDATLLTDGAAETWVATTDRAPVERIAAVERLGVRVMIVRRDACDRVDLRDVLHRLATMGIASLMIEGGGGLITSALRDRLADRMIVCIAPKVVGTGVDAVNNLDILRMGDAVTFARTSFTPLGDDVIFDGTLAAHRRDSTTAATCDGALLDGAMP